MTKRSSTGGLREHKQHVVGHYNMHLKSGGRKGKASHLQAQPQMLHCPRPNKQHWQLNLQDGQARMTRLLISDSLQDAAKSRATRHHTSG